MSTDNKIIVSLGEQCIYTETNYTNGGLRW